MNNQLFKNQTFDTLPDVISQSIFQDCTFNVSSNFDRCNIERCTFTAQCSFNFSNLTDCTVAEGSAFYHSNQIDSAEEEARRREIEETL